MKGATLRVRTPSRPVRGVALLLHGGRVDTRMPTRPWQLAVLRMRPFASVLRAAGSRDGLAVARLRYQLRGWNGQQQASVADTRWALDQLHRRFPGAPIAIVGHSMGGRTAIYVADDPAVRVVVALAPWIERDDPVEPLRGRRLLIVHGSRDRVTDPLRSAVFAHNARSVAAQVTYLSVRGSDHAMLRRARLWHDLAGGFVTGALWSGSPRGHDQPRALQDALAGEPSLVV
jgi:dienelactone hydrolase